MMFQLLMSLLLGLLAAGDPSVQPTSSPTKERFQPTLQPTAAPTRTSAPTYLYSIGQLNFRIDGLSKTNFSVTIEKSTRETIAEVTKIPMDQLGPLEKIDISVTSSSLSSHGGLRRQLPETYAYSGNRAVSIHVPLQLTLLSKTDHTFGATDSEESIHKVIATRLQYSFEQEPRHRNLDSASFIDILIERIERRKNPLNGPTEVVTEEDKMMTDFIIANYDRQIYPKYGGVYITDGSPTMAPTNRLLQIGEDKPAENIALFVIYSGCGVIFIIACYLGGAHYFRFREKQELQKLRRRAKATKKNKITKIGNKSTTRNGTIKVYPLPELTPILPTEKTAAGN